MGKDYFNSILMRLRDFLGKILAELSIGDMKEAVASVCSLRYSAEVPFAPHDGAWADEDRGLFGWERDEDTYKSCRDNFDAHLLDEFMFDFKTISPNVREYDSDPEETGTIDKRDYYNILKDEILGEQALKNVVSERDFYL